MTAIDYFLNYFFFLERDIFYQFIKMIIILFKNLLDLPRFVQFDSNLLVRSLMDLIFPAKLFATRAQSAVLHSSWLRACASIIVSNFDENIRGIITLLHNDQS